MPKLFLREEPSKGLFSLDRTVKKRLTRVLRMKTGDALEVFTPGRRWECCISKILTDGIELSVVRENPAPSASKIHLILAQSIPKGEKFDWLIQKATELGVSEIFPLVTERTIVHPPNSDSRVQRWNRIAEHAAGQSENSYPTLVHAPETLERFLQRNLTGLKLLLHEREEAQPLRTLLRSGTWNSIIFVVGPEGGWSLQETRAITEAGFRKVHLGSRILRAETAGLALSAILQYELGDF